MSADKPIHTLVLMPRSFGRALLHRAIFSSLAQTQRVLIAITHADHAAVFDPTLLRLRMDHHPDRLDLPLSLPRQNLDAETLRRLGLGEAFVLEPRWADARIAAAAGISRRYGFAQGLAGAWVNTRVPFPGREHRGKTRAGANGPGHAEDNARGLAACVGGAWAPGPLHVPEVWTKVAEERLAKAHIELHRKPILGLYLGSEGSLGGGHWPARQFEALVNRLRREHSDWQFLILTPEKDLWQSVLLYERTGKIHPVLGPDLALDSLAAVLSRLDLFLGADSWLLHLAAAVGTPTVGLFQKGAARHAPRSLIHSAVHSADHSAVHWHLEHRPLDKLPLDEVFASCEAAVAQILPKAPIRQSGRDPGPASERFPEAPPGDAAPGS